LVISSISSSEMFSAFGLQLIATMVLERQNHKNRIRLPEFLLPYFPHLPRPIHLPIQ
jgi:hypothetical protein